MMQSNNFDNTIIKVGLTGGIGSGKSTIAEIFYQNGIDIIDADKISHEIIDIYPEIKEKIKISFKQNFFDNDDNFLRRKLGNFIFKDKAQREKLENIVVPYIKDEIFKRIDDLRKNGKDMCLIDAPTLIESGFYKYMDYNILVWTDEKTQIERVKKRDNMTGEDVINRIKSQMPFHDKKRYADYIIDNSGGIDKIEPIVQSIIKDILYKK